MSLLPFSADLQVRLHVSVPAKVPSNPTIPMQTLWPNILESPLDPTHTNPKYLRVLIPLKRLSERRRAFLSLFLSVFAGAELGAGTSLLIDWQIRNGYQSTLGGAAVLLVTAAATLLIAWVIFK